MPPSTGHTTLTALGGNNWNVDSFFDVVYEIDFQGCPGSILKGFAGTTQGQLRMQTGAAVPEAPLFTGSWLVLAVTLFGGLVFYATRRLQTA